LQDADEIAVRDLDRGDQPAAAHVLDVLVQLRAGRAKALRPALIDGAPGAVWTHRGETRVVFAFTFTGGTITGIEQIADPERIARFEVAPLKAGLKTQLGQLAGSSGIALARTTLA
jgi:RNA polymerase sigma-70 factor (ECF subfamily)